ncbi:MAG TPA: hypothetical protein DD381_08535 [Lentisphaeria bacterium]|nr:MAG: hypothetical protein A2X47_11150 [Lentisphaerae bacterium GWF2_38_69]HBM16369.1 hypothetical protein [Lentisphaeria bacterium]
MYLIKKYNKWSLSQKIYCATAFGFALGMFFGIRCEVLSAFNSVFINFFQITIIPYMIFSIIKSIDSLFYLFFISMIIYPVIMNRFYGMKYRKFLDYSISAGIVAFTTGNVFLALPVIYELMYKDDYLKKLLSRVNNNDILKMVQLENYDAFYLDHKVDALLTTATKRYEYWIEGKTDDIAVGRPWSVLDWLLGEKYKIKKYEQKTIHSHGF